MYAGSSPRKAIHDIIHNIRQIASNISKDVSTHPQTFAAQPVQDQYPPQRPQTGNYLQEAVEIRNVTSTRGTVNCEESELATQNTNGLAQGIKNAHTKIDQALRFMNDMKSKLEPERKCFSVNAIADGNKEDMTLKNAQLSYPNSLPVLPHPQETPSLATLPMTFEDLGMSPKNGGSIHLGQHDTSRFNPFAKPGTGNMAEMLSLLEQKSVSSATTNQYYAASNMLNFNSNRSNGQLMGSQIGSVPRRILATPVTANNLISATNVDLQRKLLNAASASRPVTSAGLQPGCDHNRLNQIVYNIRQKGASQQQLSLNEMQMGGIHSLTSLHEQAAAEYEMMRPNTVSHLSKPPVISKGFNFPRENHNFYQLPQPQYDVAPSHFSSQSSLYGAIGHRPNTVASGFLEAVQKATNQLSEGEPSVRFSDRQEEDHEFFRPRKLKFEKERVERPVYHTRKNTAYEEKRGKQRRVEVVEKQSKPQKVPTYQHKAHKAREQPEVYEKRNYREVVHDVESDSLMDESVVVVCHSRKQREPSCQHDSCASIQSDEESIEESVRYEIPRGKTHRTIETKRSVCANCHCKKTAKQYVVYNTNTCSGRVSRSKRSLSRKQKPSLEDHKVVFDESMNTCETGESFEQKGNILKRNKSIDCNRVGNPMGRKSHGVQRAVANNENASAGESWTLSKAQKESQPEKITFESLRKKDENQGDYVRYNEKKMSLGRSAAKDTQSELYNKVFVDQLALEFPAAKENNTYKNSKVVVQKTEIIRSSSKPMRKVPF